MQYYFGAYIGDDNIAHVADVSAYDQAYLRDKVFPHLQRISGTDYTNSFMCILQTAARYSYVLTGAAVYWCIEWDPGFVVIKFAKSSHISWAAMRSPVPEFGGRTPLPEDEAIYDEDEDNPQYNLIFTPWDAQFEAQNREWIKAAPASGVQRRLFNALLGHVNGLEPNIAGDDEEAVRSFIKTCKTNIAEMAGEGIRA
ncbi:MAG: hypothetical protein ACPGVT_04680 [Maricaulaceae bacterium]